MSDILLSFGVQNAQADAKSIVSQLESALSGVGPVYVDIAPRVSASAMGVFKSQLTKILNTLTLSSNAPITLRIDGVGEMTSQASNIKKSLDGVSASASNAGKSLDQMTTTQTRAKLSEVNNLLSTVSQNMEKWKGLNKGESASAYKQYAEQKSSLEMVRSELERGAVSLSTYSSVMAQIKANLSSSGDALKKFAAQADMKPLTAGTTEYNRAIQRTETLLQAITKAKDQWTSSKTGSTSGAYQELVAYGNAVQELYDKLKTGTMMPDEFANGISKISAGFKAAGGEIRAAGENTKTFGQQFSDMAKKFTSWFTISQAIMMATNSIRQMVSNVIELDSAMTELKKVTDESQATYDTFLSNAVDRAKSVGASLTDVVTATADYARLGYSIEDASQLADTAIIYKNVADGLSDISEASESIISTMQAFGIATDDAMSIVDKFNAVSNSFAISSAGIGKSLQRSAAAMNAAGNTIDETIALTTAANTVVQNPETVGTTMKTISMYLRAAKTEAESAGESTDGMASSVSELRQEILDLTGQKVDIQIDEDTFKSTYQILKELSAVWGALTDVSQANLLELLGGKRNSNVISALLENFDIAEAALETSMNSAGSAMAENEKYLDSIQGKISQFQASWQSLSNTVVDSDLVGGVVEAGSAIIDILDNIISFTGVVTPLLAGGGIVTFFKSFDSLAKSADIKNTLKVVGDALTAIGEGADKISLDGIGVDDAVRAFQKLGVEGSDLVDVMQKCGMYTEQTKDKIDLLAKSSTKSVSIIDKMKSAYSNLATVLGITTTQLTAALGVVALLSAAYMAFRAYQQHMLELVDAAKTAGSAWQEINSSLAEQSQKVNELKSALDSGTLSEQEAYNAKKSLYEIQQQLTSTYGGQAEGIDLVNGKIEEQLGLIRQLSAEEASSYLNENAKGIREAENQLYKDRNISVGRFKTSSDGQFSPDTDIIKNLVSKYDEYLDIVTGYGNGGLESRIKFTGDATEANEVLNAFASDLREVSSEFEDQNLYNKLSDSISVRLQDVNEILNTYQDVYDAAREARLTADQTLYSGTNENGYADIKTASEWLNDYAKAVANYNEQLAIGDDASIAEAAERFNNLDAWMSDMTSDGVAMSQYAEEASEIAEQLNRAAIAKRDFINTIADPNTLASQYANVIGDLGLDDIDLKASLNTDGIQEGEAAFRGLINVAEQAGITTDELVDILVELGYVSGGVSDTVVNTFNSIKSGAETASSAAESLTSEISDIQGILGSQTTGASISTEDYNTAALMGYADALEYSNGAMQLNVDMVNELVNAKAEEQIAYNNTQKALAQSKYIENAQEIERLRKSLDELGAGESNLRKEIESNISSLQNENSTLSSVCSQYDVITASIREATSAHQHWINSQNAAESGDMFDGALSALQHINETLNDTDSDLYGRIGRSDYKAAIDFVIPDTVDAEDTSAVNTYLESISDLFTYDSSGNQTGLNIQEFCQRAVDEGLMVFDEASNSYQVAGGKVMEDFAEGLNLAMPLVQAMFGELEEFGAEFSWADEADRTLGDLAISAYEAAEALKEIDANSVVGIDLDVTDLETKEEQIQALSDTISKMQDYRASVDVDSSEAEYAGDIISYCVAQLNLLNNQVIMSVDASAVEGSIGSAIALMQEFVSLQGQLSEANALGFDTSSIESDIAEVTGKIQNIDADILAKLEVDPSSAETISSSLSAITPTVLIDAEINPDAIAVYTAEDKTATVTYDIDSSEPDGYEPDDKTATVTYTRISTDVDSYNPKDYTRTVTYVRKYTDASDVNGTAHAGGTARAGGDWGTAPGGRTLVGELGREIVVDPHTGRWYTVGDTGAEFVNIPKGAIIFNHKQSDSLLENGYVAGRGHAYVSGTAMVTGGIPVTGMWGSGSSSNKYGSSGNYHSSSSSSNSNSSSDDIASNVENAFEEAYAYHQHLLAMEQEDLRDYINWLEDAYKDAYRNGMIELDDYRKYEEEVYEGRKDLFQDYLNDLEFAISNMERDGGNNGNIINMYLGMINDIKNEIALARRRGLDDNDDYIQELLGQMHDYEDEIADIRDGALDDAKGAVEDLIDYRIKMLKQDLENERGALKDKKDELKDFYDEQKDMLQKYYDDEKIIEERNEKRKAKSDIEAELEALRFDDSAWAQKRRLELEADLADAQKELDDFEKKQTLDNTQDLLDSLYEKQAAQIDSQIEEIEAKLNDPQALYNQALRDIQNNTQALYNEMVEYNNNYGTGNPEDVRDMWVEAKESLDEFLETFGRAYKDIILVNPPATYSATGYASGTRNASPGIKKVDEKGAEYLFTSSDGSKYRVFSGGEMVLNNEASRFLYDFAMDKGNALSNMMSNLLNAFNFNKIAKQSQPIQLTTGNIIVNGNADNQTVSEIRRAQREGIDYILKQFTRLNK